MGLVAQKLKPKKSRLSCGERQMSETRQTERRQTYPKMSRAEKFSRNPTGRQDDLTGNEWKWAGIYTGRADGESRNRCAGRRGKVG